MKNEKVFKHHTLSYHILQRGVVRITLEAALQEGSASSPPPPSRSKYQSSLYYSNLHNPCGSMSYPLYDSAHPAHSHQSWGTTAELQLPTHRGPVIVVENHTRMFVIGRLPTGQEPRLFQDGNYYANLDKLSKPTKRHTVMRIEALLHQRGESKEIVVWP